MHSRTLDLQHVITVREASPTMQLHNSTGLPPPPCTQGALMAARLHQYCGPHPGVPDDFKRKYYHKIMREHIPANMLARLSGSVASEMSSLTVYSTVSVLSSFRATEDNARFAASSAPPLFMSMPMTLRMVPGGPRADSFAIPCTRLTLTSLAVLHDKTCVQYPGR